MRVATPLTSGAVLNIAETMVFGVLVVIDTDFVGVLIDGTLFWISYLKEVTSSYTITRSGNKTFRPVSRGWSQ